MKVKEEIEKVGLKLNIQKTKIMASSPITSQQIDGETIETVADFIFGGSKITADVDCSYEIKRPLFLGRKVMTNLDSILKAETLLCQQRSVQSRLCFFQQSYMDVRRSDVTQSCPTLCNPMDYSPQGSSIHGFLQARILESVAISCPVDLPNPGIEPGSPSLQADAFKL